MFNILRDIDISGLNTFGLHVRSAAIASYDDPVADIPAIVADTSLPRPLKHIGSGSNLLFTGDFGGTLLISRQKSVSFSEENDHIIADVSAGVIFDDFCLEAARSGLWGVENLSGIPGTVGASAVQNIGAYGMEASDTIVSVEAIDLDTLSPITFSREMIGYGYRDSMFKRPTFAGRYIITSVRFRLSRIPSPRLNYANLREVVESQINEGSIPTPADVRNAVISIRDSKLPDPSVTGSAGSFFMNPTVDEAVYLRIAEIAGADTVPHYRLPDGSVKIPAAWLIDRAGCKGMTAGGAAVWQRQPLVIVNASGSATPADILTLEKMITDAVASRFGITLRPEVEHIPTYNP